jgi:hypothetical protein
MGSGNVRALAYSISLNSVFAAQVKSFVLDANSMSGSEFDASFEDIIYEWTGAAAVDPESAGPLIDARHLTVVEKFFGATFEEINGTGASLTRS